MFFSLSVYLNTSVTYRELVATTHESSVENKALKSITTNNAIAQIGSKLLTVAIHIIEISAQIGKVIHKLELAARNHNEESAIGTIQNKIAQNRKDGIKLFFLIAKALCRYC